MTDRSIKLAAGSLLHDFGKLLYRYNDGRNHSRSGYDYLKERSVLKGHEDVLECILYHHGNLLKDADVEKDALCYITYIADNIAAAADRRKNESGDSGFVRDIPSESIFNILNGNNDNRMYKPDVLSEKSGINYPETDVKEYNTFFYGEVVDRITDSLKGVSMDERYINSLLQLLESTLTFVPSSTQTGERRDISLYDHVKLTAAFSLCIEKYLEEQNICDYRTELFENSEKFYDKKAFEILSIDISGIQDFIYNISSKGALKGLRSRSFYLEILLEDIIDELLERLDLCRANVLYTGGGHTYVVVPAADKCENVIDSFEKELNNWFMTVFGTGLYAAFGYCRCSANELENTPQGSYKEIFRKVSTMISEKKLSRYRAADIIAMNSRTGADHSKECVICHRSDMLSSDDCCVICSGLKKLSDAIIGNEAFFAVMKAPVSENTVPMPFGCVLSAYTEKQMKDVIQSDEYVRSYSKNKPFTGSNIVSNLWVGDYAAENDFEQLAENAGGIDRIAVIRADVDNMGMAFVSGFEKSGENGKYETLSRTAVLSRKLSVFFKMHINDILANGEFQLYRDKTYKKRNAAIVYAGGDDLFIAGGWDDVICFAVDLYNSFRKFAQGTLTFSAGIGIYQHKFPVSAMAAMSGELEDASKEYDGGKKNAVTLFDKGSTPFDKDSTFGWEEFIEKVVGEKLRTLQDYLDNNQEHGKAMLYNMLDLIRARKDTDRLNIARFAYLLARLRPKSDKATDEDIQRYNDFSKSMYRWIRSEDDCRQLVTAIYIYVYMHRESEDDNNG